MAKVSNQKMKLLYLIKILSEKTDEEHCISMQELIEELERYDISAERKSLYDDIEKLIIFGYDIVCVKSRTVGGYYLASREFELPELKLLVDAVQASRFITQKKSRELIRKIEKLAGPYDAKQLQRQVFVAGRVKTANESIYYNVDQIHKAIQNNEQISFQYLEWTVNKEMLPRRAGQVYQVSPWALTWRDENYYLIAYDSLENKIKHYRVDKMNHIRPMEGELRQGNEMFAKFDIAEYTKKTFGMFGGKEESVTIGMPDQMVGIVMDRFGKNIDIRKRDENTFSVRVKVAVSGQFFGWITGLGKEVRLLGPAEVLAAYKEYLQEILNQY